MYCIQYVNDLKGIKIINLKYNLKIYITVHLLYCLKFFQIILISLMVEQDTSNILV